jgi:hypothetical protein
VEPEKSRAARAGLLHARNAHVAHGSFKQSSKNGRLYNEAGPRHRAFGDRQSAMKPTRSARRRTNLTIPNLRCRLSIDDARESISMRHLLRVRSNGVEGLTTFYKFADPPIADGDSESVPEIHDCPFVPRHQRLAFAFHAHARASFMPPALKHSVGIDTHSRTNSASTAPRSSMAYPKQRDGILPQGHVLLCFVARLNSARILLKMPEAIVASQPSHVFRRALVASRCGRCHQPQDTKGVHGEEKGIRWGRQRQKPTPR